jgi:hypothetical protein
MTMTPDTKPQPYDDTYKNLCQAQQAEHKYVEKFCSELAFENTTPFLRNPICNQNHIINSC